jgi:hypothetical protein
VKTQEAIEINDKELIKLIEDLQFAEGDILERKFTEKLKKDDGDYHDNNKLFVVGSPGPGAKVEIYWVKSWGFDRPDYGYIFTLPIGGNYDDIFMSGIIHIPNPQGGEKCNEDAEWVYLDRLLENENIEKIKIFEERKEMIKWIRRKRLNF